MIVLSESNDSINDVLGIEIQYEVPLYQRRYVWDEANWKQLWEDILDQERLEPAEREGHFTGPIVTRLIDEEQNKYEVIDGQQRLTTLEIIFCVIRDLWSDLKSVRDDAEKHVLYESNHKLIPTDYDRLAFREVVKEQYGQLIHSAYNVDQNCLIPEKIQEVRLKTFDEKKVNHSILDAYDYFYEQIRTYVGEDSEKISNLISTIKNDFKLIHLALGETEQAEKVFESINATGRMLSDFDYLRNNLFLRAKKLGKNQEGEFYRDIYYRDPSYWPFENNSGYWNAEKLQSFLRTFLMAKWDPKCFERENAKPFEEYREYSKSLANTHQTDDLRIPYEFKELSRWAKSYQELLDDPNFENYVQFCEDLGLPRLDAFLLFVKHDYSEEFNRVCEILESYIVRRMLVHESGSYNHSQIIADSYGHVNVFFSDLVDGVSFSTKSFALFLKNKSWPEDENVSRAFGQADSKNADFIAYVFREIMRWDKERSSLYGQQPLNLGAKVDLLTKIQNRLDSDPDELQNTFNDIWPPPFYFTQDF